MHLYMVNFEFGESELQDGRVKFKFIGMIQQLFLHGKKNPTGKKIFTTTTEIFEYKHKTTAINIEETHII